MSCFKKNNKDRKSTEPVGEFSDASSDPHINKSSNLLKRFFYPNCLGNSAILSGAVNLASKLKDIFGVIITQKDQLQVKAQEGEECPTCDVDKIKHYASNSAISAGCCAALGVSCNVGDGCPDGYYMVETFTCDTYGGIYTIYKCCQEDC